MNATNTRTAKLTAAGFVAAATLFAASALFEGTAAADHRVDTRPVAGYGDGYRGEASQQCLDASNRSRSAYSRYTVQINELAHSIRGSRGYRSQARRISAHAQSEAEQILNPGISIFWTSQEAACRAEVERYRRASRELLLGISSLGKLRERAELYSDSYRRTWRRPTWHRPTSRRIRYEGEPTVYPAHHEHSDSCSH